MAAPAGNQFWKLRSKHGRDKLFATPELLYEEICSHFKWCDENPLIEVDFVGKDALKVEIPKMRAYTLHGLCVYLGVNTRYFNDFEKSLVGKEDQLSKDFSDIITWAREVMYTQKFTAAAANLINANLIARELGIADKKELTLSGPKIIEIDWGAEKDEKPNE